MTLKSQKKQDKSELVNNLKQKSGRFKGQGGRGGKGCLIISAYIKTQLFHNNFSTTPQLIFFSMPRLTFRSCRD